MNEYQIEGVPGWHTKWPRHYIEEILQEPSREERKRILESAPEPLREWIEKSVINEFERRNHGKRS